MAKLISSINITIDGYSDHSHVIADEEHHQFANDLLKTAGLVMLGRRTYQLFESYWPTVLNDTSVNKSTREYAQLINNADKIVFSKTLTKTNWNKTKILSTINSEEIIELKEKSKKDILIFGSPGLVSELTKKRLIDEYYFSVQPMIVGRRNKLLKNMELNKGQDLKLLSTKVFQSGVVTLHYQSLPPKYEYTDDKWPSDEWKDWNTM
jgi:dihydrofolate reductase